MRPSMRKSLTALAVLLLIAAAAYYWLIMESHAPADAHYAFDIAEIRRLADASAGEKPSAIEVEQVAAFSFPATAVVAGDGWDSRDLPVYSYRLVYPTSTVIVDTALNQEGGDGDLASFDADAYLRMQAAMSQASSIVITHEHMDHIGGLAAHPDPAKVLATARLTREQIAHPELMAPATFADAALERLQPLEYDRYHALAPGVVLIKAPGHTPGSQMVYVQRSDGAEVLFLGDVAWQFRNIETQRERPRLVTWFLLKEDRTAVFGQLAALKQLHESEPRVHIVPGHDAEVVSALLHAGVLKAHFDALAAPQT